MSTETCIGAMSSLAGSPRLAFSSDSGKLVICYFACLLANEVDS